MFNSYLTNGSLSVKSYIWIAFKWNGRLLDGLGLSVGPSPAEHESIGNPKKVAVNSSPALSGCPMLDCQPGFVIVSKNRLINKIPPIKFYWPAALVVSFDSSSVPCAHGFQKSSVSGDSFQISSQKGHNAPQLVPGMTLFFSTHTYFNDYLFSSFCDTQSGRSDGSSCELLLLAFV